MSAVTDCYNRLADALGGHDVHPSDALEIQNAYLQAGGPESATWDDLPEDIRRKVEQVETTPAQTWDDPADVPDTVEE